MAGDKQRTKRLLTKAEKNPALVLEDKRCVKPHFCEAFFAICDDKALRDPPAALEFSSYAVELAAKTGDRHLMNRAASVRVHAHIANQQWDEAEKLLEGYQKHAVSCCAACTSELFRRRGDLMVEVRRPTEALDDLVRSVTELGDDASGDDLAKIRFVRGIGYHFHRDPERALDDAGQTLLDLALDAPRGYFLDTLAFIACFLQHTRERSHAEKADEWVSRFRERIKDVRDWTDVRLRLSWVEGAVYARLGDARSAARLSSVRQALFKSGPVRHALAAALDEGMLLARRLDERSLRSLRTLVSKCLRELDLDEDLQRRLRKVEDVLCRKPEKAFHALDVLRRRVVVPVPGLL